MPKPRFISLEGLDGAGKSTHLDWLTRYLTEHKIDHLVSREPGGTPLGEKLRSLLLSEPMHVDTEALLMFAARREHVAQVIEPTLAAGRSVVSDRFTDASYAYQGGGRNLGFARVAELERWALSRADGSLLQPDLTLIFDIPLEVSRARLAGSRDLDRFEREHDAFFERVRAAYLERARLDPERVRLIDASQTIAVIQQRLAALLAECGIV
ncbi:dTMP kinase [Chitinimonas lacunae]|uniref:Thymidylate kinase n=1 Tax=Chitinimonas lacunae TaxID=1963018 RepID=A0ABV8MJ09_9NEIS